MSSTFRWQNEYLFDWSLPQYAPELLERFHMPRWFTRDLLQTLTPGTRYRDVWPSLFIAPQGLHSDLHVDAFGSHFWMALFEGTKRWTFYRPEDLPWLEPSFAASTEPSFEARTATAAAGRAGIDPFVIDLQAGDLLFVPAGCPHTVENLEPSLAVGLPGRKSVLMVDLVPCMPHLIYL
jgi:hypothetical protein